MEVKVCNGCGVEKPLSEYYREAKGKGGRRGKCKACESSLMKTYNQNPLVKERKKVSNTLWRANNKEKVREYDKTRGRIAYLKYMSTLKGKLANKRRTNKWRGKLKDAGTFTNEEWNNRLLEYNYCCAYCYKPFTIEQLTVDHMIPLSRGGTNTIDNLVPACKSCNSRKKDKTPLEMLQKGLM
jgi:5-methylcytosine-specific restriction endonuclease McrA